MRAVTGHLPLALPFMRILLVCHRFPYPPDHGGKIRPFNVLRHLAPNHAVTVASIARCAAEAEAAKGIAPYCAEFMVGTVSAPAAALRMIARLPTPTPSSMGFFHSPDLARRVRAAIARAPFDLIFVHTSSVAPYVQSAVSTPKIMDFCDMDSQKWLDFARIKPFPLSLGYRLEGLKMMRAEKRIARAFDLCTCATPAELATYEGYGTGTPGGVFPNGVDLDYFKGADAAYDPDRITFVGRMNYFPNEDAVVRFCNEILPRVRARRPNVSFTIVGADPGPKVRQLASLSGVTVTGTVPDVRPYVQSAALTVAPIEIARGTQNKILESMAMGVPAVASRTIAGGIDAVAGEHFLAAATPDAFADAVLRLLENPDERARFARAGRARVESHHSWAAAMARLDQMIEGVMRGRARPTDRSDSRSASADASRQR